LLLLIEKNVFLSLSDPEKKGTDFMTLAHMSFQTERKENPIKKFLLFLLDQGSILQNSISDKNFSDKFSSSNCEQSSTKKQQNL
jgi:hypothetical protein